jgi:hypothetical protein
MSEVSSLGLALELKMVNFLGVHFDIIWSITISSKITNVLGQLGKVGFICVEPNWHILLFSDNKHEASAIIPIFIVRASTIIQQQRGLKCVALWRVKMCCIMVLTWSRNMGIIALASCLVSLDSRRCQLGSTQMKPLFPIVLAHWWPCC